MLKTNGSRRRSIKRVDDLMRRRLEVIEEQSKSM